MVTADFEPSLGALRGVGTEIGSERKFVDS
jgi:hypothetical protein